MSIKKIETVSSCLSSTANHSSANLLWSILDSINRLHTYLYSKTVSIIFDHITSPMAYFANNQVSLIKMSPKGSRCLSLHPFSPNHWLVVGLVTMPMSQNYIRHKLTVSTPLDHIQVQCIPAPIEHANRKHKKTNNKSHPC